MAVFRLQTKTPAACESYNKIITLNNDLS